MVGSEVFPQKIYDVFTSKNTISLLFPNYPALVLSLAEARLIFNFICYPVQPSPVQPRQVFTVRSFSSFNRKLLDGKQDVRVWSGLVCSDIICIKLIPGGVSGSVDVDPSLE